jgi:hypothetical protein
MIRGRPSTIHESRATVEEAQDREENLLIDREILESFIERILNCDPDTPDLLAHLFVKFQRAIEDQQQPTNRITNTLKVAIELIYIRTDAHAAALKLYLLYQQGHLLVKDYPLDLINAAIERSSAGDKVKGETNQIATEEKDSEE